MASHVQRMPGVSPAFLTYEELMHNDRITCDKRTCMSSVLGVKFNDYKTFDISLSYIVTRASLINFMTTTFGFCSSYNLSKVFYRLLSGSLFL